MNFFVRSLALTLSLYPFAQQVSAGDLGKNDGSGIHSVRYMYERSSRIVQTNDDTTLVFKTQWGEVRKINIVKTVLGKNAPTQVNVYLSDSTEADFLKNATLFLMPADGYATSKEIPAELNAGLYFAMGAVPLADTKKQQALFDYLDTFHADTPYALFKAQEAWSEKYMASDDEIIANWAKSLVTYVSRYATLD